MRRKSKEYEKPRHPWDWRNLAKESELRKNYGLKNKKEIWKAQAKVRKYRKIARNLIGQREEEIKEEKEEFLEKLRKKGFIKENGGIDNVLSMNIKDYLERRLQTIAWRKGYGRTPKQSRQLITHGHIKINERKTTKPGVIIPKNQEDTIKWYKTPVENAKADKKPQKETVSEKTMKEKTPKVKKKSEKKETPKKKGKVNYEEITEKNISEIKKEAKDFTEEQYKKLLEAEEQNKDRKTMKEWINKQINKGD